MLKVACRWPGRDSHPQRESYESDTLPLDHLHLQSTEAHGCEQLAQSCYPAVRRQGVEHATSDHKSNALTTTLPSHPVPVSANHKALALSSSITRILYQLHYVTTKYLTDFYQRLGVLPPAPVVLACVLAPRFSLGVQWRTQEFVCQ